MLYLANTNSTRVRWGDKYNLHKKKSLFILLSATLLAIYFKMFKIWEFLLHLH